LLLLHNPAWSHVGAVSDHLRALVLPGWVVTLASGVRDAPCPPLSDFDAVIVHYSVRLCVGGYMSPRVADALDTYSGAVAVFVQDEYDRTNYTRAFLSKIGPDVVYTCTPPDSRHLVYPPAMFPSTRFRRVLTGYVPQWASTTIRRPIADRSTVVGYRGRDLGAHYGRLGAQKREIGELMRPECERRRIAHDIAWDERARKYGPDWVAFLSGCRAVLGTESGSSVFDWGGQLRANGTTLEAVAHLEGQIDMRQISPKVFESIAAGCALVLYPGAYSGVINPWTHYLPLQPDGSNLDEVFAALARPDVLQGLADRAYDHVIASGAWSYSVLTEQVDADLRGLERKR